MSKEPFQDLVAKVEAEKDTRRKIWIVREYDLKRNGTKNNQIECLNKKLAEVRKDFYEEIDKLKASYPVIDLDLSENLKATEKERDELAAQVGELIKALKNRCPCWGGESGNPEGHSRNDCPQKKALSRPAPEALKQFEKNIRLSEARQIANIVGCYPGHAPDRCGECGRAAQIVIDAEQRAAEAKES